VLHSAIVLNLTKRKKSLRLKKTKSQRKNIRHLIKNRIAEMTAAMMQKRKAAVHLLKKMIILKRDLQLLTKK